VCLYVSFRRETSPCHSRACGAHSDAANRVLTSRSERPASVIPARVAAAREESRMLRFNGNGTRILAPAERELNNLAHTYT
jgi:hypothetical protein